LNIAFFHDRKTSEPSLLNLPIDFTRIGSWIFLTHSYIIGGMSEKIFEIDETRPKSPVERWAEAQAAAVAAAPSHPQIAIVQRVAHVLKAESNAVQRNLEATRREHEGELDRMQKIFEKRAWQQCQENRHFANKSLEFLP
jgi:hypothetical protein